MNGMDRNSSELGNRARPRLGHVTNAVAVPVMLVLILLSPLAPEPNLDNQMEENKLVDNQVVLEDQGFDNQIADKPAFSVEFDRSLSGDRVGQHKVPPLTSVTMTITATVSSQVENAILADYFPSDWTVVDANGGIVNIYDENYNKIEWNVGTVGDFVSRSYVIRSPQLTSPPTKYYFRSELIYNGGDAMSDDWMVIVADPSAEVQNLSISPDPATPGENVTVTFQGRCDNNQDFYYAIAFSENDTPEYTDDWVAEEDGVYDSTMENVSHEVQQGVRGHNQGGDASIWYDYEVTIKVPESYNGSYYVIVIAGQNGVQCASWGTDWDTFSSLAFTVGAAPPGKPVLYLPENGTSTTDNTPYFEWTAGSGATSHRLVIDNDPGFADGDNLYDNANLGGSENSCTIENELPPGNYWWKVAAINSQGENWSETWTFEVVSPNPPIVTTQSATDIAPYYTISQRVENFAGYATVKPAMLGDNRYLVMCKGYGWGSQEYLEVYHADENWNLGAHIDNSPVKVQDQYVKTFPDILENKLVIFGTENADNRAFIATFDVTTLTWEWESITTDFYITDVVWAPNVSKFYIVPHRWDPSSNYIYESTKENLLASENWEKINLPAFTGYRSEEEKRIEYFDNYLYIYRSDQAYSGDLLKYDPQNKTFTQIKNWYCEDYEDYAIFGMVRANHGKLGVTIAENAPSPHFTVYYSIDGENLIKLTEVPIYPYSGTNPTHSEAMAYIYPLEHDIFLVHNVRDDNASSFIAIYDNQGNELKKLDGTLSHYTEARPVSDNLSLIIGGETSPDLTSGKTDLKVIDRWLVWRATLHGAIENTGGENCDERGFEWDNNSGTPYVNSWTETGNFGTGSFSYLITELDPDTTYYFRAKAHNSAGWGYGDELSFSTSALEWRLVETWSAAVSAPAEWHLVETWTGTVTTPTWHLIETWSGIVSALAAPPSPSWNLVESWSGTVSTALWAPPPPLVPSIVYVALSGLGVLGGGIGIYVYFFRPSRHYRILIQIKEAVEQPKPGRITHRGISRAELVVLRRLEGAMREKRVELMSGRQRRSTLKHQR